ncbi:hypothetical protein F7725_028745, partial [Dissostichus mawsoni]
MMFSSHSQAFHKEGQELTLGTTSVHSTLSLSLIIKGSNEARLKPRIAPSHTLALLILNLLQDVFVIFAESSATMSSAVSSITLVRSLYVWSDINLFHVTRPLEAWST